MRKYLAKHIVLASVTAAGLLTGACGNNSSAPTVAGISTSATSTSSVAKTGSPTTGPSAIAYSQCMRAHGIADFPDPNGAGELALNAQPGSDLEPDSAIYKAADGACKSLLPPQQAPPAGLRDSTLKYAKCMRSHGIADFPDPKADGTLQVQANPGSDLDPNNPQYKKADTACRQFLPNGGVGGSLSQHGAP